jgi:hypothetical protein
MAEKIIDPDAKQAMLDVAESYELIAERAARRQQADLVVVRLVRTQMTKMPLSEDFH